MSLVILSSMFTLTPAWVLALSIVIVVIYCASLGADALGRASELFFTIVVLSFVIGLILLMTGGEVDYMYLTPVLARGFGPVIGAAWVPLLWYATSSSLVLGFGKYCSRPGLLPAAVFKAVLISGVFQLALVANAVATFGPVQAVNQMSPIVSMARTLCIPGFIERLDVLLLSVWAVGIVFDITVTFFVGTAILAEAFGTTPRVTALVVGVPLSVGIVMRQTTIFEIGALLSPSYAMALTLAFHIGLVGTLLATSLLTKKGGPSHGGRSRV